MANQLIVHPHVAAPAARHKFRCHIVCIVISALVAALGVVIGADLLVLGSPAVESTLLAFVELGLDG